MVEFLGIGVTHDASEVKSRSVDVFDPEFTKKVVAAHEDNGWDGLIFHYNSFTVDPSMIATYVSTFSDSIDLIVAVRPNTCAPTYMAKKIATLDNVSKGRARLHVIAGGHTSDQAAEGDFLEKDLRYDRASEFIEICRRSWSETETFSYSGNYFTVENFYTEARLVKDSRNIISTAGMSDSALRMAAKHSDRHALWGMPLEETRSYVDRIRRYSKEAGREGMPEIQMQFRPILGSTTAEAKRRAEETMLQLKEHLGGWIAGRTPETAGAANALEILKKGEWHDECFWAGPVAEVSGGGNNTALVGTPSQISEALCNYHDAGVTVFGFNGYDTYEGAVEFGQEVIPLVREDLGC